MENCMTTAAIKIKMPLIQPKSEREREQFAQ